MTRTAGETEIKSAYRKLAMQFHPDRNPGDSTAEEKFKECSEAYAILMDRDKRAAYDRFGHAAVNGSGAAGGGFGFDPSAFGDFSDIFGDIFGEMFGGGGGRGRRSRVQRGNDLREDLELNFEEAVFGMNTQVRVRRHETCDQCKGSGLAPGKSASTCATCSGRGQVRYQQGFFSIARTCPSCHGAGQVISDPCTKCRGEGRVPQERMIDVKVPAGVEDGTRIRYAGQGEAGANGGPAGDLYIVLHVKEHKFFEREGNDLYCTVPISFVQAALGAEISIPTLDGEQSVKIPEGTQSSTTFRIRGKGVPVLNSHGKGDLFVQVKVQTPTKLTKRQRELLQELEGTIKIDNRPDRGLLSKVKDIFG